MPSPIAKASYLLLGGVVILNLVLVIYWTGKIQNHFATHDGCQKSEFELINQSLSCNATYSLDKASFISLRHDLVDYIDDQMQQGQAIEVSVYVRDLYNGPTLNIDALESFSPASLLKLPLLITYLDLSETDPDLLQVELIYIPPDQELVQGVVPKEEIEANTPYSVDELLRRMMAYSDNRAYYALLEYLRQISPDTDLLLQTYIDLGLVDPDNLLDETVSTKTYAGIFHQLFHASYFSQRATSEKALEYLLESVYDRGLVAGLPKNIKVAHKFGERYSESNEIIQLHDCGIIYYPDNPYSLCVMTKGKSISELEEVISEISQRVYEEFERRDHE